jgi:hypothetical protein
MSFAASVRRAATRELAAFGSSITYWSGGLSGTELEILGILDWEPLAPMPGAPEIPTHDWTLSVANGGEDGVSAPTRSDFVDLVDPDGVAVRCKVCYVVAADEGMFLLAIRRGGPVPEPEPEPEP